MKKLIIYLLSAAIIITLCTCKKYEEGGFVQLSRKHLFGERRNNASKKWKLKLFEVNGIDSTNLIPGIIQIPNFHDDFITFTLDNKDGYTGKANTFIFNYNINLGFSPSKELGVVYANSPMKHLDSTQCDLSKNICTRNLLIPEFPRITSTWQIVKLKKNELIIIMNQRNNYKIILTH